MCCLESNHVRTDKHIDDVYHEFFSIFYRSNRFCLYSNTRKSLVNVLLFRNVFLVCSDVSWILSWLFLRWRRLVWDTRLFFIEIVFFVFDNSLLVSMKLMFVIFYRRRSLRFSVVFPFSYRSKVLCIEL